MEYFTGHMDDHPKEACGLFGITNAPEDANLLTYHALFALQHRGQTSAGIAVSNGKTIRYKKGDGLVPEVFDADSLNGLTGHSAIGHVRYAAEVGTSGINAHPIVVETLGTHIALAFNGSLTNAAGLRIETENKGGIFQTTGDAEIILYRIVAEMLKRNTLEEALLGAMPSLSGAYSLLLMTPDKIIAARDPQGFRPLCVGMKDGSVVIASESCALDAVGAEFLRDIQPGEVVVAQKDNIRSFQAFKSPQQALCVFEMVYFARPDSVIDGVSVELSRQDMGRMLAKRDNTEADVVIGVPDSGLSAALGYAQESGIPYSTGFVKNRYIGRTFIKATQSERVSALRIKLNALAAVVRDKRVIMVDDSIVRGTTCARIVSILREAGAAEVHMRVSSPPYLHPCYFGTDIPNREQLIACGRTEDELAKIIGVDSLQYLRQEDLALVLKDLRVGYCDACFTGNYPIPLPQTVGQSAPGTGRQSDKEVRK